MTVQKITISLENEVFQRIEKLRGNKTHFRSAYINQALREKMGLPARGAMNEHKRNESETSGYSSEETEKH